MPLRKQGIVPCRDSFRGAEATGGAEAPPRRAVPSKQSSQSRWDRIQRPSPRIRGAEAPPGGGGPRKRGDGRAGDAGLEGEEGGAGPLRGAEPTGGAEAPPRRAVPSEQSSQSRWDQIQRPSPRVRGVEPAGSRPAEARGRPGGRCGTRRRGGRCGTALRGGAHRGRRGSAPQIAPLEAVLPIAGESNPTAVSACPRGGARRIPARGRAGTAGRALRDSKERRAVRDRSAGRSLRAPGGASARPRHEKRRPAWKPDGVESAGTGD